MMISGLVGKYRLFPYRTCAKEVICKSSVLTWFHLLGRWFSCPFELIKPHIPLKGNIYDMGCGHGLMLNWLALSLPAGVRLWGWDIDERKISFAKSVNRSRQVCFERKDISTDVSALEADCIVLNDVLYAIPFAEQDKILRRFFHSLRPGGVLVLKEVDTVPFWKYYWTGAHEFFSQKIFFITRGRGVFVRPHEMLVEFLREIGFQVKVIPIHSGYLHPHILYLCSKN